jgi:hypothetical protein
MPGAPHAIEEETSDGFLDAGRRVGWIGTLCILLAVLSSCQNGATSARTTDVGRVDASIPPATVDASREVVEAGVPPTTRRNPECGPVPAYVVRSPKGGVASTPAALDGEPGRLTLTWVKGKRRRVPERLIPGKGAVSPEHDEHEVALVLSRGNKELRVALGTEIGNFQPELQRACGATHSRLLVADANGELSSIGFSMGGWAGFAARLERPGLLQIVHFAGSDGRCADVGVERTEVRRVEVPADASFVEALRVDEVASTGDGGTCERGPAGRGSVP